MVKQDNTYPNNPIVIGETAEENTQIISQAKQTDIWFHLANLPSCHVIITCDKKNPITKNMILYCAQLVKENTKYKNYKKVTVNYTPIKNVKKTSHPGKVIIKGKSDQIQV